MKQGLGKVEKYDSLQILSYSDWGSGKLLCLVN